MHDTILSAILKSEMTRNKPSELIDFAVPTVIDDVLVYSFFEKAMDNGVISYKGEARVYVRILYFAWGRRSIYNSETFTGMPMEFHIELGPDSEVIRFLTHIETDSW